MAKQDQEYLLSPLKKENITIKCKKSQNTTFFENIYHGIMQENRIQKVKSIADSFSKNDIVSITAPIYHLGPLTRFEMPINFISELSKKDSIISMDIQGFLRKIENEFVNEISWEDKQKGLKYVDILKTNVQEAMILSGEKDPVESAFKITKYGPKEVIITLGSKGSLIINNNELYQIPAYPPNRIINPTGCGDTYMAGYLYKRTFTEDINQIGHFAAKLATLNLESYGPVYLTNNKLKQLHKT